MPPASRGVLTTLRFVRNYAAGPPRSRLADLRRGRPLPPERPDKPNPDIIPAPVSRSKAKGPSIDEPTQQENESKQEHQRNEEQKQEHHGRTVFDDIPQSLRRWVGRFFFVGPPLAFFLLFLCPVEPMRVSGSSMSPFLNVNSSPELPETADTILVQRVLLDSFFRPHLPKWEVKRGEVIVFRSPTNPEKLAVKRVVGIPGDIVKPLPGYSGGEEPIVIPFNHIWVEGDANSRDKSVDSNWYGPISLNLVIGCAKILMTPWYSWKMIRPQEDDYPAKKSGRVEFDAVLEAKINPDKKRLSEAFSSGEAARELIMLRKNREILPTFLRDKAKSAKMRNMYATACRELDGQDDPDIIETAQGIVDELEAAFEAVGLAKNGNRLPPGLAQGKVDEEASLQKKRLENYLAENKSGEQSSSLG